MDTPPVHHLPPRPSSESRGLVATAALLIASVGAVVPLLRVQNALFLDGLPPRTARTREAMRSSIAVTVLAVRSAYWPRYSALAIAVLAFRPTGLRPGRRHATGGADLLFWTPARLQRTAAVPNRPRPDARGRAGSGSRIPSMDRTQPGSRATAPYARSV